MTGKLFDGFMSFALPRLVLVSGFGWGASLGYRQFRDEAIEHGYARYHPTTGEWEWIEPEGKHSDDE